MVGGSAVLSGFQHSSWHTASLDRSPSCSERQWSGRRQMYDAHPVLRPTARANLAAHQLRQSEAGSICRPEVRLRRNSAGATVAAIGGHFLALLPPPESRGFLLAGAPQMPDSASSASRISRASWMPRSSSWRCLAERSPRGTGIRRIYVGLGQVLSHRLGRKRLG